MDECPIITGNAWVDYMAINTELTKLAAELKTDLTTVAGFMWYISKIRFKLDSR